MFNYADKDRDSRINFDEFLVMITPVKVPIAPIIYAKPKKPNNNKKNTVLANGTTDNTNPGSLASKTQGLAAGEQAKLKNGKDPQKTHLNADQALTDHANSDHDNHDSVQIVDNVPITIRGTTEVENLNFVTNTTVNDTTNNPTATKIPTTKILSTTAATSVINIPVATLVTTA